MPSALESPEAGEEDILRYEEMKDNAVRWVLSYTRHRHSLGQGRRFSRKRSDPSHLKEVRDPNK